MKHIFLILLTLLLPASVAVAQGYSTDPSDPLQELRDALSTLDPNRVGTGVLMNRTVAVSNPHRFAGQGDTAASAKTWQQQYWEFYNASLNQGQLATPEDVQAQVADRLEHEEVPLLMLKYRYNEFSATAADDGLITIDSLNERVYDGPDLSRSPYEENLLFSVAPALDVAVGTMSVYVGPEFWFGNEPAPASVWIDFGDGQGPQEVAMGSTVEVQVNGGQLTSGTVFTQAIQVQDATDGAVALTSVQQRPQASVDPHMALGLVASRSWPGFTPNGRFPMQRGNAKAIAWIRYADSNTNGANGQKRLRKPLVFVEGIDFEETRNKLPFAFGSSQVLNYPVASTGIISLSNFTNGFWPQLGGYRNGEAGWNELVDYNEEYKALEKMSPLRQQMQAAGNDFDIIYLDFSDGASLIQHNAMVLVELLEWINNPANHTPDAEETVVVGVSMGGQVARFGLAWMEQQGLCHNSKLYVSIDSPHRGANIPIGVQAMFDRLQNIWFGSGPAERAMALLRREAAQQMLVFHIDNGATTLRNQWQGWQNSANSYPSLLRRVAVANGSGFGAPQAGMWTGMQLLRTSEDIFGKPRYGAGYNYAYALPGINHNGNDNVVFRYKRPYSWSNWNYFQSGSNWGNYDTAAGGSGGTIGSAAKESKGKLEALWPSTCFIPTTSALDVFVAGPIANPDLGYNVLQQIPSQTLPNRAKYNFDAYSAPATSVSEGHIQITNGQASAYSGNPSFYTNNSAWILNELRESSHYLPAVLTVTYNYGSPYRHYLPSMRIGNGGLLYVNNGSLPASGGTPASQTNPVAGNFELNTSSCGSQVLVERGGQLLLGRPGNTHTAEVKIGNWSLLHLQAGSTTVVEAGSILRLQRGSGLIVRNGATLRVNGQVLVEDGAALCIEAGANLIFSASSNLHIGQALPISITGFDPGNLNCTDEVSVCGQFYSYYPTSYRNVYRNEALHFDGADDVVVSPLMSPPSFVHNLANDFTVEAFVQAENVGTPNTPQSQILFSTRRRSGLNLRGLILTLFTYQGTTHVLLQLNGYNYGYGQPGTLYPTDGRCHQVAVTRVGATNELKFYLDGQLTYTTIAYRNASGGSDLCLGADAGNSYSYSEFFQGTIGELRVWDISRTDAQIRQNLTARLSPQNGLVTYYDMQDASTSQQLSDGSGVNPPITAQLGQSGGPAATQPAWVSKCQLTCDVQGNFRQTSAAYSQATGREGTPPQQVTAVDTMGQASRQLPGGNASTSAQARRLPATIAPNPATGTTTLYLTLAQAATVRVRILDLSGWLRLRLPASAQLSAGPQTLSLPLGGLAPGFYLVGVDDGQGEQMIRLHVE